MNTPTPETDAKQKLKDMIGDEYVSTDFARKLERERDDAIQARKQSAAEWLEITRLADIRTTRAKRERDEAREQLAAERELADRLALALKMTRWDSPVTCKKALTAWKEARRES